MKQNGFVVRQTTRVLKILVLSTGSLFGLPGHAATCDSRFIVEAPEAFAATVADTVGDRLHFQKNGATCPSIDGCQAKAYLVPGDKVVVGGEQEEWVCAHFKGPRSETSGWLPRSALLIDTNPPQPVAADWNGVWRADYNYVRVTGLPDGQLDVASSAQGRGRYGSMSLFGTTTPDRNRLSIEPYPKCTLSMRWVGGLVVITNTPGCVTWGATHHGIYRRTALSTELGQEKHCEYTADNQPLSLPCLPWR